MHSFEHDTDASRTVFGTGTLSRVGTELAADRWAARAGPVHPRSAGARDAGGRRAGRRRAGIFDGAAAHTPVEVTDAALARAQELAADSVVSVGGGSTTGLGKALAARTGLPHLVLPTTYAGSEVTSLLGETADGEKVTRTGPEILPRGGRLRRRADHHAPVARHRHQRGERDGPRGRGALRGRPHRRDRPDRRRGARRPGRAGCGRSSATPTTWTPATTCSTERGWRAGASAPWAWGCTTSSATPSAAASASRTPPPTPWCSRTRWPTTLRPHRRR